MCNDSDNILHNLLANLGDTVESLKSVSQASILDRPDESTPHCQRVLQRRLATGEAIRKVCDGLLNRIIEHTVRHASCETMAEAISLEDSASSLRYWWCNRGVNSDEDRPPRFCITASGRTRLKLERNAKAE